MNQASECIDSRQRTVQPWNDMHPKASESMSFLRRVAGSLESMLSETSQVFILTDENVAPFWLPEVAHWLHCDSAIEIVIKAGEQYKNLQTVQRIWKALMKHHADRNAMLINLGGGTITDLGGFAASTYKRGIKFINVPTTLLAMVDAAIGGKTGIDFGGAKNQIGTFAEAEDVMINPVFLETLPPREIHSGLAEMLKYGFIADANLLNVNLENYQQHIVRCGEIKRDIVAKDPTEKGLRKIMNFGHTLGHAIESYCLTTDHPLLHGEAVALGMVGALWLSVKQCCLDEKVLKDYEAKLPMLLSEAEISLSEADIEPILSYLVHDKKNKGENPQFVLLEAVGMPVWGVDVEEELVKAALHYIINLSRR
ncbi:MAG: 3-dehydroquinate synthase [Bacteroidales bacterium]|nr:3-dehydroquinate synthase [Bacteroidales bacterium]